jgi:uncharacterized protein YaiE (UPF0345 family)
MINSGLNFKAALLGDGTPLKGTIGIRANILGNNQGISYNVITDNNSKKFLGTLFPGSIVFIVDNAESIELLEGSCQYRFNNDSWQTAQAGEWINTPPNTKITLEIIQTISYICHLKELGI